MRRGSSLTPLYFFTSVRGGSGKSTIVSNLSVYLNDLNYKCAIIDLDYENPLKLKQAFPESVVLQEYPELTSLVSSNDPRFQKNFYFVETNMVSYFPAHHQQKLSALMADTAMRDFFIQLANTFEIVIVNMPAGVEYCRDISNLLTKSYLWRGCKPISVITSLSEEKSLIELDQFIQSNQIVSYQAEENTYFLFNRVPSSPEEQSVNDTVLNISEVRKIFTYPLTYIIPFVEEFLEQRARPEAVVLQPNSYINQCISGLCRVLNGSATVNYLIQESISYQSCISGQLLSKLYPYLDKLQKRAAGKLFVAPEDVQIFLEQNDQNYRIRMRLTSVSQQLLGIRTDIPEYKELRLALADCPSQFSATNLRATLRAIEPLNRETVYTLSLKPVYTFPDCFSADTKTTVQREIPIAPTKQSYPSPLLFQNNYTISEIPTLSNIIGLSRQRFNLYRFEEKHDEVLENGVNQLLIPPDFDLQYAFNINMPKRLDEKEITFTGNFQLFKQNHYAVAPALLPSYAILHDYNLDVVNDIYDIFSRDKAYQYNEHFTIRELDNDYIQEGLKRVNQKEFSLIYNRIEKTAIEYINPEIEVNPIAYHKLNNICIRFSEPLPYKADNIWYSKYIPSIKQAPKTFAQRTISSSEELREIDIGEFQLFKPAKTTKFGIRRSKSPKKFSFVEHLSYCQEHANKPKYKCAQADRIELENYFFKEPKYYELPKNFPTVASFLDYSYRQFIPEWFEKHDYAIKTELVQPTLYIPKHVANFATPYRDPDLSPSKARFSMSHPELTHFFKPFFISLNEIGIEEGEGTRHKYSDIFHVQPKIKSNSGFIEDVVAQMPTRLSDTGSKYQNKETMRPYLPPLMVKDGPSFTYTNPSEIMVMTFFRGFHDFVPEKFKQSDADVYKPTGRLYLETVERFHGTGFEGNYKLATILGNYNHKNKTSPKFVLPFEKLNINLFVQTVRSKIGKLFPLDSYKPDWQVDTTFAKVFEEGTLSMDSAKFTGSPKITQLQWSLESHFPLRIHKITSHSERLDNEYQLSKNLKIESAFNIINARNKKSFDFDNQKFVPFLTVEIEKPSLKRRYIFKKIAMRMQMADMPEIAFAMQQETSIDILYKHKLWELTSKQEPVLCDFNEAIIFKPIRDVVQEYMDTINIDLGKEFRYKDLELLKHSMNKPRPREYYSLKTNSRRDLINLARQQTQSVSVQTDSKAPAVNGN